MSDDKPAAPTPPLPPFANGRDSAGRFVIGNRGGPGNPAARRVARLRQAMLGAVRPSDLRAVVRKLVEMAVAGDLAAASLLLDRVFGRPTDTATVETAQRISELERVLER